MQKLYIGSDHGGFKAKERVRTWLERRGDQVIDCGATQYDPYDDYPLIAEKVARLVQADQAALGILLCRSGQGVAMVANKFPGIRAATAWNTTSAHAARADDAVNILCLPADYVAPEELEELISTWLAASLQTDPKYARRLQEITTIEDAVCRHGKDE